MRYPKHLILDLKSFNSANTTISANSELINTAYAPLIKLTNVDHLSGLTLRTPLKTNYNRNPNSSNLPKRSLTSTLFTIHFLRKEKLYTKLKYSRCPQYDIVSGGFAAIFAGFIGFLISEKFGIELVDSGDFYNAFMYAAFATLSIRPFLLTYSADNTKYHPLSPKYLLLFLRDLVILFLQTMKFYLKKLL